MTKAEFFKRMEFLGLALSFDDVRLKTGESKILPVDADLSTIFSRRVPLKIPIVSAAMDTVTEAPMAIELAKLGGLGIIHRAFSPKEQAKAVTRVKLHMNGLIDHPICVRSGDTIESVLKMRKEKSYPFHSFPVINRGGKLVGLLTQRQFDMCEDISVSVSDVMTTELVTSPVGTSLDEAYKIMREQYKKVLPLVDEKDQLMSMYVFSDIKRIVSGDAAVHNVDENGQLLAAAAIGTGDEALKRAELLVDRDVDAIVIDTAHGDSKGVYETLKKLKNKYGERVDVVVGNVSQADSAKRLVEAGADGIKIGQGPGSTCTTRIIAGVGRPQVTAIYECAKSIKESGIPVCADGGIRNSGDITIAIAAGAHSVMLGGLLAGTDPTPGDVMTMASGQQVKAFRGMGSLGAMLDSAASRERYRQEKTEVTKLVPEGVEGAVPYKGPLSNIINQYMGGLRSGMAYVGAETIEGMREEGNFDRISFAGLTESHPHSMIITQEAPNYYGRN